EIVGDSRALLLTLLGASALLLFVACANIANLLLVGFALRRRELSLRAALGATRRRIAAQLAAEVAILVVPAGIAGLFIGRLLAGILVWWGGTTLPRLDDIGITPGVAGFALAATASAALACGVVPACLLSNAPAGGLGDSQRGSAGGVAQGRVRRAFGGAQVAAALVLLVTMFLTVTSFRRLQAVDPGFDGRGVLTVQLALPPARYATPAQIVTFADVLRRQLTGLSGVR